MWNARLGRPRSVERAIESWWVPEDTRFQDGNAEFWRATPDGRFFLLRSYFEDNEIRVLTPGKTLDVMLPIWRISEALLHASRMAAALDAPRVELMARWGGLLGRRLGSVATPRPNLGPFGLSDQRVIETGIEVQSDAIEPNLPRLVRKVVSPLFAAFDFFDPPSDFYEREIAMMRRPV
jgi:hypothetical protein